MCGGGGQSPSHQLTFAKHNGCVLTYAPGPAEGEELVLVYKPLAVSPLIELELRRKNDVGRYETHRLVPKFNVSDKPVIAQVRSITQTSFFFADNSAKRVAKPAFKHHRNPLIKSLRMIKF